MSANTSTLALLLNACLFKNNGRVVLDKTWCTNS